MEDGLQSRRVEQKRDFAESSARRRSLSPTFCQQQQHATTNLTTQQPVHGVNDHGTRQAQYSTFGGGCSHGVASFDACACCCSPQGIDELMDDATREKQSKKGFPTEQLNVLRMGIQELEVKMHSFYENLKSSLGTDERSNFVAHVEASTLSFNQHESARKRSQAPAKPPSNPTGGPSVLSEGGFVHQPVAPSNPISELPAVSWQQTFQRAAADVTASLTSSHSTAPASQPTTRASTNKRTRFAASKDHAQMLSHDPPRDSDSDDKLGPVRKRARRSDNATPLGMITRKAIAEPPHQPSKKSSMTTLVPPKSLPRLPVPIEVSLPSRSTQSQPEKQIAESNIVILDSSDSDPSSTDDEATDDAVYNFPSASNVAVPKPPLIEPQIKPVPLTWYIRNYNLTASEILELRSLPPHLSLAKSPRSFIEKYRREKFILNRPTTAQHDNHHNGPLSLRERRLLDRVQVRGTQDYERREKDGWRDPLPDGFTRSGLGAVVVSHPGRRGPLSESPG
ncbi:hypothetical protein K402DRAFT_430012 [Aulographum hederae CBS 113979]|uniref:Uncharacterized protein n=1 Tax=Aulographum hederae CBS 113979 TaxID=1176131 RepID=A0A6G1H198_9PEZI|nr:hypothetical protein K402DRAFT_430012 [Aulographum hederae CBS 113979]